MELPDAAGFLADAEGAVADLDVAEVGFGDAEALGEFGDGAAGGRAVAKHEHERHDENDRHQEGDEDGGGDGER